MKILYGDIKNKDLHGYERSKAVYLCELTGAELKALAEVCKQGYCSEDDVLKESYTNIKDRLEKALAQIRAYQNLQRHAQDVTKSMGILLGKAVPE